MFAINAAAKKEAEGNYTAEVAITLYADGLRIVNSTQQRVVSKNHQTRELAETSAVVWITENLFPIVEKLKLAKP